MSNPRFFHPHAPQRIGTSHEPALIDRDKGTHPDKPTDRLKQITRIMKRMPRPSTDPSKISVVAGGGKNNSATAAVGAKRGGGRSGAQAFAAGAAKSDFEPCSYDKHKMNVDSNWEGPTFDFARPTSRNERAAALKFYESHQNDLQYFDTMDDAEEDPRRHRAKPEYRVGGLGFNSYTSRKQRAKSDRSTLQVEREAQAREEEEEYLREFEREQQQQNEETEEEVMREGVAGIDEESSSPLTSKQHHQQQQQHTADSETIAKNQKRVNPYHDAGVDPITAAKRAKEEALAKASRPNSASHVRGVPNFERSVHNTVSRLTEVARDDAVVMGTAGSQAAALEAASQKWQPFSLSSYNVTRSAVETTKYQRQANILNFGTMSGHDGYQSEMQGKRKKEMEMKRALYGDDHPSAALGANSSPSTATVSEQQNRYMDEGLKYNLVDKRSHAKSVPNFSKSLGKDAPFTGYAAPKGGSRGGVESGLSVSYATQERHKGRIDISKSAMRPEAKKNNYCTNMTLFPKYDVVDLPVKSPRIGPGRKPVRPSSAPGVRPIGSENHQTLATDQKLSQRAVGGTMAGRLRPQSAAAGGRRRSAGGSDDLGTSSQAGSGHHHKISRLSKEVRPAIGDVMNGYRNDDFVHPRITRNIRM